MSSPRARSLCCGVCLPWASVYAAAGRDALLNSSGSSRDRRRSRGGPGTAIVFPQNHPPGTHPTLFIPGSKHTADVHTQVQYTHTHTFRDNELCHNKGRALDCSPVAMSFHCCSEKEDFGESHQHFHIHIVCSQYTNTHAGQRQYSTVHKHHLT